MKTDLPRKDLERFMRDNMSRDKVYTLPELYRVYLDLMRRDGMIERYSVIQDVTLRRRTCDWEWMATIGKGDSRVYFKYFKYPTLREECRDIINDIKGWIKWPK